MTPSFVTRSLQNAGVPRWGVPLLIGACIVLQAVGRSAEVPLSLMAIAGLWQTLRRPAATFADPMVRAFAALFACFWLPMLASLTDAVDFPRALETTLVFLRFFFMAVFIRNVYRHEVHAPILTTLVTATLGFWALDGLLQAVRGTNLFGDPHIGGQLTGVFHPHQTLGHILAVLSPLFLLGLLPWLRRQPWLWLAVPVYAAVIILSAKRGAWIMLATAAATLAVAALFRLPPRRRVLAAVLSAMALLAAGATFTQNDSLRSKFTHTLGLFSGDFQQADDATSGRLTIWRTASAIWQDHWLNGVGPRAFRNIYPDYAAPGDIYMEMNPESGPTHPHQISVEIGVETGSIGLAGFALFWLWLLRELWRTARARQDAQYAYLAALAIALLPLNTGHAFYANFWSGIVFWLLAMYLAVGHATPSGRGAT